MMNLKQFTKKVTPNKLVTMGCLVKSKSVFSCSLSITKQFKVQLKLV